MARGIARTVRKKESHALEVTPQRIFARPKNRAAGRPQKRAVQLSQGRVGRDAQGNVGGNIARQLETVYVGSIQSSYVVGERKARQRVDRERRCAGFVVATAIASSNGGDRLGGNGSCFQVVGDETALRNLDKPGQIYETCPQLDVLFLLPRTRSAETKRWFGAPQAGTVELSAFVRWSPLVLQPLKADTSWFLTSQPIGRKNRISVTV